LALKIDFDSPMIDEEDIIFIDPGSIPHFPTVMRQVMILLILKISLMSLLNTKILTCVVT